MSSKDTNQPDAPPSYAIATGSSTTSTQPQPSSHNDTSHLGVPAAPRASRKSMEDEHQFFVDTKADPPRSIWVHPMDDEETWNSLSSEEKERLQAAEAEMKHPSHEIPPYQHDSKDPIGGDEKSSHHHNNNNEQYPSELPARPGAHSQPSHTGHHDSNKKPSLGERLKTKVTGLTKEEREAERRQQAEQERQYYEAHARFRAAMHKAQVTGQPQWFAKDKNGQDVYVEPPQMGYGGGGYGRPGYGGYGGAGYGYSPYGPSMYSTPNGRYIRPQYGYGRPGYGGGLALPVAGGLLGGALLGGLLF
ncbi:uncharacterized protein AB675_5438 [Cyphellophora attinorum]|uniref:WW domain-containing protein n=1 Tax=Cyphellophora attinorum TaxID=1664694 RepID=A0A0N1HD60_9EURO|nr:uncharacterized protein AB675_5438 [Phialophora attinorum]KPI42162.1 hypothetical protein AB675_5438 [Phialophora attinorum]